MVRTTSRVRCWVAVLLCAATLPALAAGGRVQTANQGMLMRAGESDMALTKGQTVKVGDTVSIAEGGSAQIWMEDDSVYALAADSKLRIEQFQLPTQKNGGAGRSVMSLLNGAMRGVSGLIGKGPGDVNEVRTGIATMGIRGTTYSIALCEGGKCKDGKGKDGKGKLDDGLYVMVEQGVVVIASAGGTLEVPAGKTAFVANNRTKARFVDRGPFVFVELEQDFEFDVEVQPDIEPIEPPIVEPPVSPS